MTIEQIAEVAHEANRAYCMTQQDFSQPHWANAEEWQKKSAINGVKFHLDNPDARPSASHESWLKEKQQDGWVYGPVKDPERKVHPCMVPFEQLPQEQRLKDFLFTAIVNACRSFVD